MGTRTRLILLLLALTGIFVGALTFSRHLDGERTGRLYDDVAREKRAVFGKVLDLTGAALKSFSIDYTFWDEMVRFVQSGDRAWGAENIEAGFPTFGADAAWVYNTRYSLVYSTNTLKDRRLRTLPLSGEELRRLFAGRRLVHFFLQTPHGVMELRGATIHPTNDSQRKTPPRGYFLVGRLWTAAYLAELSGLIGGDVTLHPPTAPGRGGGGGRAGSVISFSHSLKTWDGRPLARIQVRSVSPMITELRESSRRQFLLLALFSVVVLLLPAFLIARWVNAPLQRICTTLVSKDVAALAPLVDDRTEFGHLARLVRGFFEQSELIKEVAQRRRTEEDLQETEERFHEVLENASDVVFAHDLDGRITAMNPAGEGLLGYARGEARALTIVDLFTPDSLERVRQEIARQMEGGPPLGYEVVLRARDGAEFPAEVVTGLIHARGRPVGVQGIARNITERRRAAEEIRRLNAELEQRVLERTAQLAERERELHEAKAFLEHLIAGSPSVIFRLDPRDETVTYVSPNVHRFLGYRPSEILRRPRFWAERIHPEDRERVQTAVAQAAEARAPQVETEYRFRRRDGEYRWLAGLARLEYGAPGLISIFGYALDITERKAAEEAVRQAKTEAERANLAKNEFLSRMSHELRTPLNAILGFAQLLEMDPLPGEQGESVTHILKGGQHLLELINEVLDISRIETGRLSISPEPVHMVQVLQEALDLIAPLATQRAIQVSGDPLSADYYVLADLQRLKQVLLNLLSNAVKYNNPGGSVTVTCTDTLPGQLRISVRDTGRGIPEEKIGQLFTPFARLGAEYTGVEGTGIGLVLSKGLVELMGGEIGVESVVGQGSTFWVDLPLAESQLERAQRMWQDVPAAPADGDLPMGAGTILYIEDNLANLDLLQRVLADHPQIKLLAAMQGRLGLDLARQHRPNLILLDVHLPDLSGEEVLRRLRSDPLTQTTPVVIISADPAAGQTERLLALGADSFLGTPIDIKELLRALGRSLREVETRHAG